MQDLASMVRQALGKDLAVKEPTYIFSNGRKFYNEQVWIKESVTFGGEDAEMGGEKTEW